MQAGTKIQHSPGFSLIEILLVLSVIGILASAGLGTIQAMQRWMATARTRQLFHELELSLRQYKADRGYWPTSLEGCEFGINGLPDDWKTELAPYLTGTDPAGDLVDGFGNSDIRVVLDRDGDQLCDPGDMPGLPEGFQKSPVWKQVAIYSLDESGQVVAVNWDANE